MTIQRRIFDVHRGIISSVIKAQSGTLGKALMELVMNSIDAGATRVRITLTNTGFVVSDDGRGIETKEQLVRWFETFGTPHVAGDATFGKFRVGRGQAMGLAKTRWRTGPFIMSVDICDGQELGYDLEETRRAVSGCSITGTLYSALSEEEFETSLRETAELVRYAAVPVFLNSKKVSRPPSTQKWTAETDDVYIRTTDEDSVAVYNLGMFVCRVPRWKIGTGGVVCSKKSLQLSVSRNEILQNECEVWRRVQKALKKDNIQKVLTKSVLTKDDRDFLSQRLVYSEVACEEVLTTKLVTDVAGRHHSLQALALAPVLSYANESHRKAGERVALARKAIVLGDDAFRRFQTYNLDEFLEVVLARTGYRLADKFVPLGSLALQDSTQYTQFADADIPELDRWCLKALREVHDEFFSWFHTNEKSSGKRELYAGASRVALAWTDGSSYVVFRRSELLKIARRGVPGCLEVLLTLLHEYCHDQEADLESHSHSEAFLTRHHDLVQYHGSQLLHIATKLHKAFLTLSGKDLPVKPVGRERRSSRVMRQSAANDGQLALALPAP